MTKPMPQPAIRKGRKFDQVLEGARTIFLRDGFEGASVDDIAREAGVSKATLYSYFPDKRLLFMEVAKCECARQADEAAELIEAEAMPVEKVLRFAAERFIDYMSSEFALSTYRLCVAEADRFPQLGHDFYHSGPELVRQRMVDYLKKAAARGEVKIEDFELAADQFAELCKVDIHNRLIFGIGDCCDPRDRNRIIDGAIEMFLARYGVRA
ncbi:TetR/AcrR family transcriptional regulator [Pseudothioclava nitratireducens]|uniref:TetR/AcrR family transcriptional regulator n=1 Tax=Pseudothioclava nitratireducens TaxID=1928646 RepID=UPI0023DB81BA|nr:TetR/AcrR family transcriptional regulator [Defluviimonas nitratireducens]MDF1619106.1 TetR/AcrR family transcriptional regulator [Defluviimonas nitratireducens]